MPKRSDITTARINSRREILFSAIPQLSNKIGVEIGPLCYPTLTKDESNVLYLDRVTTSQLIAMFSNDYPGEHIVDVDIVSGDLPLQNVLASRKFDYFIANHVIEHVPDVIDWLMEVHSLLNDDGFIFLAVPDKRFTFDVKRMETSCGHIMADYENDSPVDAAEHIVDALLFHETQPDIKWEDIGNSGRYSFIHHHHVFCYDTFLELIITPLIRLKYLQYSVVEYKYSKALGNEFIIVLQKEACFDNIRILGANPRLQKNPASSKTVKEDCKSENYQLSNLKLIIKSGLFDEKWYSEMYPVVKDAGIDPLTHYYYSGYKMGFNPSPGFNSLWYLEQNHDVAAANYNPLWHYIICGQKEGRHPAPPPKDENANKLKRGAKS